MLHLAKSDRLKVIPQEGECSFIGWSTFLGERQLKPSEELLTAFDHFCAPEQVPQQFIVFYPLS